MILLNPSPIRFSVLPLYPFGFEGVSSSWFGGTVGFGLDVGVFVGFGVGVLVAVVVVRADLVGDQHSGIVPDEAFLHTQGLENVLLAEFREGHAGHALYDGGAEHIVGVGV